jgi:hypothetical protein
MIDGAAAVGLERGRLRGFLPRSPAIGRAKDRRSQMTVRAAGENRPRVARVGDRMMDDVSEKMRAGEFPRAARASPASVHKPLRVAINSVVFRAAGAATVFRVEAMVPPCNATLPRVFDSGKRAVRPVCAWG